MLSIVIPVYAQAAALRLTLSALAQQSADVRDFEVVLVDDASPTTPVADIAALFPDLPIRVERHAVNLGRAAARNTGIRAARGSHILFLDADSVTHPELVQTHLQLLDAAPDTVVIGRRVEPGWDSVPLLSRAGAMPATFTTRQDDIRRALGIEEPGALQGSPWLFVYTHNMSVPAEALKAVGGFDERFRSWGWEDTELAYRLFLHWGRDGDRFVYAPTAVCFHVPHFTNHSSNWAEAAVGLDYLKKKHQHFDVERLGQWPVHQILTQPAYASFVLRPGGASEVAAQQLHELLPTGTRRLWAGRLAGEPAEPAAATMDCTRPVSESNKPLLGISTPWADDSFDDVVHWDNWRVMLVGDLSSCITESLRLAPVVYLAGTRDLHSSLPVAGPAELALVLDSARLDSTELPGDSHVWVTEVRRR